MTRISFMALGAVAFLAGCTPPEMASRMDSRDTMYSGFGGPDIYTAEVAGARAENDFMRFSTMSMVR